MFEPYEKYQTFFPSLLGGLLQHLRSFVIPLIILALIGPFAVIPRCITVAYGSFTMLTESVSLAVFSIIMCVTLFLATLDHKKLIPLVIIIGAALLLACDIVAQVPFSNYSLPINAVTSLVGAPLVIWLIVKKRYLRF